VVLCEVIKQAETPEPMSEFSSNLRTRYALALILLLAVAVIVLFESPYSASNLAIVPDSVEYATSAWRIVHEGRYAITINGTAYPPRYPPGFALIALAPAHLFPGQDPGCGIYGILFWSVIGVLAAFAIGRRLGGIPGGLMAGAAVLLLPDYRQYSQVIMSDATCTAMTLLLLLAYLRLTAAPHNWKKWLCAGLLSALVAAIRPTGLSATLPFLFLAIRFPPRRRSLSNALLFLLPILLLGASQLFYNHSVFGTPFRSGYQYWCPVPLDYTHLTFGFSHLPLNARAAWQSGLLFLLPAVVILFLGLRRFARHVDSEVTACRDCLWFVILSAAPLSLFHFFYFFGDSRFFLPITGPLAVLAGATLGALLRQVSSRIAVVAAAASLTLVFVLGLSQPEAEPTRRHTIDLLNDTLPKRALLISHTDPVYLDFFLNREGNRVVLPLSRDVEYASKIVAPARIPMPDPPPAHARDHRCQGILNGGGLDLLPAAASEPAGVDAITTALDSGIPVFLDATHLHPAQLAVIEALQRRFRMRRTAASVYQLLAER
jgi:hypothetical protein